MTWSARPTYEVQVGAFEHQGHAQAVLAQVRD